MISPAPESAIMYTGERLAKTHTMLTYIQRTVRSLGQRKMLAGCLLIAGVIIGLGVGLSVRQATESTAAKQAVLAKLSKDQQAVSQALAAQSALPQSARSDISTLTFRDISDSGYAKRPCSRLEGRAGVVITSVSCEYRLRAHGALSMAVVFVYESGHQPNTFSLASADAADHASLRYTNTYLKNQAARYKVADPPQIALATFGPFELTRPVAESEYRTNGYAILDVFNETSKANKIPEDQYDMVHFVLLGSTYGGVAFPGLHRAFTFDTSSYGQSQLTISTFVHETLHLFGASDKYNNNDCNTIGTNDPFNRYGGSLPGKDIMCDNFNLDSSGINDITAREIGWAN